MREERRRHTCTPTPDTMTSAIIQAAFDARLSPLVSRLAVIVAGIAGKARAMRFIEVCKLEGESRGIALLAVGTVLK